MDKKEKKQIISKKINLDKGRFKDDEIDLLYDLVTNKKKYNKRTKTKQNSFSGISSDGKYTRKEKREYIIKNDDNVSIEEKYSYSDDDGQMGENTIYYQTGREIINILRSIFDF